MSFGKLTLFFESLEKAINNVNDKLSSPKKSTIKL